MKKIIKRDQCKKLLEILVDILIANEDTIVIPNQLQNEWDKIKLAHEE